jgi:hypothetical protein
MNRRIASLFAVLLFPALANCLSTGSAWKVHGGAQECARMCAGWGLEFAGMVGVGSQEAWGDGATACVCQVRGASPVTPQAAATAASLAAPIARAAEEEHRRKEEDEREKEKRKQEQEQQQKQQAQNQRQQPILE